MGRWRGARNKSVNIRMAGRHLKKEQQQNDRLTMTVCQIGEMNPADENS